MNQQGSLNHNWRGGISKNFYDYKKKQWDRYPDRVKARQDVSAAIRSGKLVRGTCEFCGSENVQAHHDDYSKPLDVRWMCRPHHRMYERGLIIQTTAPIFAETEAELQN